MSFGGIPTNPVAPQPQINAVAPQMQQNTLSFGTQQASQPPQPSFGFMSSPASLPSQQPTLGLGLPNTTAPPAFGSMTSAATTSSFSFGANTNTTSNLTAPQFGLSSIPATIPSTGLSLSLPTTSAPSFSFGTTTTSAPSLFGSEFEIIFIFFFIDFKYFLRSTSRNHNYFSVAIINWLWNTFISNSTASINYN